MDEKNMSLDDLIKRDRKFNKGGRGGRGGRGGHRGGIQRGGAGLNRRQGDRGGFRRGGNDRRLSRGGGSRNLQVSQPNIFFAYLPQFDIGNVQFLVFLLIY